jgi:hypothetical protein
MRTETGTLPGTPRNASPAARMHQELEPTIGLPSWQPADDLDLEAIRSVLLPVRERAATAVARVLPFAERMGVVTELMVALDLATRSGQEHLMNKVLTILRGEMLDAKGPLPGADLASLLGAMSELEHEAGRVSPLPNAFNRHAQVVIDALLRASATSEL